jgi:hypothetical protein
VALCVCERERERESGREGYSSILRENVCKFCCLCMGKCSREGLELLYFAC